MEIQFFPYPHLEKFFNQSALNLNDMFIVYDIKPLFIDKELLLDYNSFCLKTWKNGFANSHEKICIFLIKKFSYELIYALFRNKFKKAIIFTEDSYIQDIVSVMSSDLDVILYSHKNAITYAQFSKLINIEYIQSLGVTQEELEDAFNYYLRFIQYHLYWLKYYQSLITEHSSEKIYVLADQEQVIALEGTNTATTCFILDYHNSSNLSKFKKVYFLAFESLDNTLSTPSEFLFKFFNTAFLQIKSLRSLDISLLVEKGLLNYSRFSTFKHNLDQSTLKEITTQRKLSIDSFAYLKTKEYTIGKCVFPFNSSQTFFLSILQEIRNKLRERNVYIKQLVPDMKYFTSNTKVKKFGCRISFPIIFTKTIESKTYLNKKDACNDVCAKYMQHLIDIEILDANLSVKSENLMKLDQVEKFYNQRYGKISLEAIEETKKALAETVTQCPVEYYKNIVISNGILKIIEMKLPNAEEKLLKSMYALDCNPIDNKKDSMSDIKETLSLYYRKIPSVYQENTSFLSLYTFSNSKTGILCAHSGFKSITLTSGLLEDIAINSSSPMKYTQEEIDIIKYYQLIFFKIMNLPVVSEKQNFLFHYFVVPLNETYQIDWAYLKRLYNFFLEDYSYNFKDNNTFLWNHVSGEFLYFSRFSDYKLTDVIEGTSLKNFFEKKFELDFNKSENNALIETCLSPQISSLFKRKFNYFVNETAKFIDETRQMQLRSDSFLISTNHVTDCTKISLNQVDVQNIKCNYLDISKESKNRENSSEFSEIKYQIFRYLLEKQRSHDFIETRTSNSQLLSLENESYNEMSRGNQILSKKLIKPDVDQRLYKINQSAENIELSMQSNSVKSNNQSLLTFSSSGLKYDFNQIITSDILSEISTIYLYPTEICYKTPVKHSILIETELFKRNFRLIEDVFIANEIANRYDMSADLSKIIQCFTSSNENIRYNYERLEFLGDCILKFIATNHLFISGFRMNNIVSIKDSIVCNENLYRCCLASGLIRYIRRHPFNLKMVQPPALENYSDLINYFKISNVFSSNNYAHFAPNNGNIDELGIKFYADVVEAFIGLIYLTEGIDNSYKFVKSLGIIYNVTDTSFKSKYRNHQSLNTAITDNTGDVFSTVNSKNSLFFGYSYKTYAFQGFLSLSEISAIEDIFGYVFNNKGNLERASVHPSFTNSVDCTDFQYLELIGDSALDMFVNSFLYPQDSLSTPLMLHTAKISYVNNISLRKIFYSTKLDQYVKASSIVYNESKAFSDIVEAIIGAILIDLEWDVKELLRTLNKKFKKYLELHRLEESL